MRSKWFGDCLRTDIKKSNHDTFKIIADLECLFNVQISVLTTVGITIGGD